jgi:hypothetical protein
MLCLKTINTEGEFVSKIGEMIVPYDIEKIVRDTKYFDFDTVTIALELFSKLGLIYKSEDDVLKIADFSTMVGKESESAERVRNYRKNKQLQNTAETQKALHCNENVTENVTLQPLHCNENVTQNVTVDIRDKRLEIRDKRLDTSFGENAKSGTATPSQIVEMFHDICKSYPKVRSISEARKKAIQARLRVHGVETIREVFEKAENSDFLKGKNNNNWSANFDWLMKDNNFSKTLDGMYDNRQKGVADSQTYGATYDISAYESRSVIDEEDN